MGVGRRWRARRLRRRSGPTSRRTALGRAPAIQPKSSDVAPGSRVATSRVRLLSFDIGYTLLLLELSSGYPCMLFGAAARPARRDAATTATVVAVFRILIFRNFKRFEDVNRGTVWPKKKK